MGTHKWLAGFVPVAGVLAAPRHRWRSQNGAQLGGVVAKLRYCQMAVRANKMDIFAERHHNQGGWVGCRLAQLVILSMRCRHQVAAGWRHRFASSSMSHGGALEQPRVCCACCLLLVVCLLSLANCRFPSRAWRRQQQRLLRASSARRHSAGLRQRVKRKRKRKRDKAKRDTHQRDRQLEASRVNP